MGFNTAFKAGYVKRILPVCNAGLLLSSQTTNQEPTIRTVGLPELETQIKIINPSGAKAQYCVDVSSCCQNQKIAQTASKLQAVAPQLDSHVFLGWASSHPPASIFATKPARRSGQKRAHAIKAASTGQHSTNACCWWKSETKKNCKIEAIFGFAQYENERKRSKGEAKNGFEKLLANGPGQQPAGPRCAGLHGGFADSFKLARLGIGDPRLS